MDDFYDQLAPLYHLIYQDWNASIVLQGDQLSKIIQTEWPGSVRALDVSCGIGTQAIALATKGYLVTGSDLSAAAVERAQSEASSRQLEISFSVSDMREAFNHHGNGFDVVISADNSVPHLLTDDEILLAFRQMHACLRPGGGCVITVRDYEVEERSRNIVKPIGVRLCNGKRYLLFQVWDFEADFYDLTLSKRICRPSVCRRMCCDRGTTPSRSESCKSSCARLDSRRSGVLMACFINRFSLEQSQHPLRNCPFSPNAVQRVGGSTVTRGIQNRRSKTASRPKTVPGTVIRIYL
jgi:SAM-dependent methyltransferase